MSKRGHSSEGLLDVACPAAKRLVSAPALAADGLVPVPEIFETKHGAQYFIRETVAALLLCTKRSRISLFSAFQPSFVTSFPSSIRTTTETIAS